MPPVTETDSCVQVPCHLHSKSPEGSNLRAQCESCEVSYVDYKWPSLALKKVFRRWWCCWWRCLDSLEGRKPVHFYFILFYFIFYLFMFVFWPHHTACRILVPWPGIKPMLPSPPPHWQLRVLTTGPPAKSSFCLFKYLSSLCPVSTVHIVRFQNHLLDLY